MSSLLVQEVTDKSVAANIESIGPKRSAAKVDNSQRETAVSQSKASEQSRSIAVGANYGGAVLEAIDFIEKRFSQMQDQAASRMFEPSARNAFLMNMEINARLAQMRTLLSAAQAQQKLHEMIMRSALLDY